jgi:hypothetical protein
MAILLAIIIALVGYAVWYLPVYFPFVLSFFFRGPNWRELRLALRGAPVLAIFIIAARPRPPRPEFGDDVAGSMRGSQYYFAHEFWPETLWTWGAGFVCLLAALVVGFYLRARRQQSTHEHVTHNVF